jgi:calcium-dependent protein kinase
MISPKDPFTLKIIDFGLSRTFNTNDRVLKEVNSNEQNDGKKRRTRAVLKTKAGTPFYIAPEVLTGNYNEKCDVWSAGVILYILFCGYPPFYGESNKQILEAVKQGKLDFSSAEWKDKSKEAIELIKKMICDQHTRLFTDQVLNDPWMSMSKIKVVFNEKIKILYHNMKKYAKLDKLRKMILYFISKNLQEEDICHYHNYYFFFDQKNNGSIDKESFVKTVSENVDGQQDDLE